jgi:site-specific DNA-methyltransferase (cytosine-N4-specific)
MLSKSKHYYFDWEAIAEPVKETSKKRLDQDLENQIGSDRANVGKKTNGNMKAACSRLPGIVRNRVLQYNSKENKLHGKKQDGTGNSTYTGFNDRYESPEIAMKRNVWTIPTQPTKEAHFATFPEALVEPCILAGCQPDGIVLDPFLGSGTTMLVALRLSRKCIGIEMNKSYLSIIKKRILPYENMLI